VIVCVCICVCIFVSTFDKYYRPSFKSKAI